MVDLDRNDNSTTRSVPLDVLGLSRRAYNALRRAGIYFLKQLLSYSNEDLLHIRGVGAKTLEEIRRRQRDFDSAAVRYEFTKISMPEQQDAIKHISEKKSIAYLSASHLTQRSPAETTYYYKEKIQTLLEKHGIQEPPNDLSWRSFLKRGISWQGIEELEKSLAELGLPSLEKLPQNCIVGKEILEYLVRIGCPLHKIAAGRATAKSSSRVRLHSAGIRSLLDVCLLSEAQLDDLLGDAGVQFFEDLDWYLQYLPSRDWDSEVAGLTPNPVVIWRLQRVALDQVWVAALSDIGLDKRDISILIARSPSAAKAPTLEELGKQYKVTRERVRQIEARGKRDAREALRTNEIVLTLVLLARRIINEQVVINRRELAETMIDMYGLREEGCEEALSRILFLAGDVEYDKTLDAFVSPDSPKGILRKLHSHLHEQLHAAKAPVLESDLCKSLNALLSKEEAAFNDQFQLSKKVLEASQDFERVDEVYWGLTKWEKRVLDEIVMALREAGKPTHFKEIANLVNERLRKDQQTTARATHAKLAHHRDLFMRTGPGTFGLREWDPDMPVQPTKYRTLIKQVLGEAGEPIPIDAIYERVNALRPVKMSTVAMYLYLHDDFVPHDDGCYGLSAWDVADEKSDADQLPEEFGKRLQERAKRAFANRVEGAAS